MKASNVSEVMLNLNSGLTMATCCELSHMMQTSLAMLTGKLPVGRSACITLCFEVTIVVAKH
jgi:hypothetical protein